MLPLPIISNTYINPVEDPEYLRLKDEIISKQQSGILRQQTTENQLQTNWNSWLNFSVQMIYPLVNSESSYIMYGSPNITSGPVWVHQSSHMLRVLQHAYPSYDAFQSALINQDLCMYTRGNAPTRATFGSLDRNNYVSVARGISALGAPITDFIYYDRILKKAMRYNPSTGSTPVQYYND